jgi:uncharacterized protein
MHRRKRQGLPLFFRQAPAPRISAFGTEAMGGSLTNTVISNGKSPRGEKKSRSTFGCTRAHADWAHAFKSAVLELAKANNDGITNVDASKALGLQSDYHDGSRNYLAWSILGLLTREGKISRKNVGNKGLHVSEYPAVPHSQCDLSASFTKTAAAN